MTVASDTGVGAPVASSEDDPKPKMGAESAEGSRERQRNASIMPQVGCWRCQRKWVKERKDRVEKRKSRGTSGQQWIQM